jgi:hypothetical protein
MGTKRYRADTLHLQLPLLLLLASTTKCLPVDRGGELHRTCIAHCRQIKISLLGRYDRGKQISDGSFSFSTTRAAVYKASSPSSLSSRSLRFAIKKDDNHSSASSVWMNRKNFFVVVASLFVSSSLLLEVYSRIGAWLIWDDKPESKLLPPPHSPAIQHATIVFHGSGGQDSYTEALMQRLVKENPSQYNQIVEWTKYSSNIFQASYNGERIGRLAANELLDLLPDDSNIQTIHLIGISVGSFAADAAARELVRNLNAEASHTTSRPFIQLTLLDPFTQRGIFGFGYGNRVFGAFADYTQQYMNTDDPVPSTNEALQNSVCYDITHLRPKGIFGHDWPVVYYGKSDECGKVMVQKDEQQAKGSVVLL